ncbi:hypothetical protein ABVK25_004022 [Lepraria finkii]|uniref:Uncharacterized protein n=1 Tax=Lepraria finkii TaxID=1340010 RepID=A0ABR4BIN6_9LECA
MENVLPPMAQQGCRAAAGRNFVGSRAFGWTEKFIDGFNNRSVVDLTSASINEYRNLEDTTSYYSAPPLSFKHTVGLAPPPGYTAYL